MTKSSAKTFMEFSNDASDFVGKLALCAWNEECNSEQGDSL